MTLIQNNDTLLMEIFESLKAHDEDTTRQILELLYNAVMKIERQEHLGAGLHERS